MLKVITERTKEQKVKMISEYNKTRLFEKVTIYPCIRRVFLSRKNHLEVGCVLDTNIFICIMRRLLYMQIQVSTKVYDHTLMVLGGLGT